MNKEYINKDLWWWNKDYKKDRSIAYFNSLKAGIDMVVNNMPKTENIGEQKKYIKYWRDFFLKEHNNWYLKTFPKPRPPGDIEEKLALENRIEGDNEGQRVEEEQFHLLEQ